MKQITNKDDQITFHADVGESLANAIRRYLSQVQVLAINEVEISKNDSPLYDETVAHRLGLIPLITKGAVNEKTEMKLKLDVKKEGYVYSGDLKGEVQVVHNKIPITTLAKDQEVKITATVTAGKGSDHSKFSPGLMFYRNISEITMPKELQNEVKRIFPHNEIKEKGNKIIVMNDQKNDIEDACQGICEMAGKECEVSPKEELVITLESFGQMSTSDIIKKSVDALKKDLADVAKHISK
ncbi:MAG: DNA-directed RNA polymerase subunit D [Nanoarchaeota archaeon]